MIRLKFAHNADIAQLTDQTPKKSFVRALARFAETKNLHARFQDGEREWDIPHQPTIELFQSHNTPLLEIFRLSDDVLDCDWSPGNMSRYDLVLSQAHRGIMLTWLDRGNVGGRSVVLIGRDPGYLGNKMRMTNNHDLCPMLDLIAMLGYEKPWNWIRQR